MGEAVQHPFAAADAGDGLTVIFLVQEKSGFLPVFKVYLITDTVFHNFRYGFRRDIFVWQRKKAFSGGKRPHTVFCKKTLENLRAGRIIMAER